jgi:hypothetical protein
MIARALLRVVIISKTRANSAKTSRIWINPPTKVPDTNPRNQKTNRMTNSVNSTEPSRPSFTS